MHQVQAEGRHADTGSKTGSICPTGSIGSNTGSTGSETGSTGSGTGSTGPNTESKERKNVHIDDFETKEIGIKVM